MAELFIWAAAAGLGAIGYYSAKQAGMFDEVPREPGARLSHYNSLVIDLLKRELFEAEVHSVTPDRVEYGEFEEGRPRAIWFEKGEVYCSGDTECPPRQLGSQGTFQFSLVGRHLSVLIVSCEIQGLEHKSELTLPVTARGS